VRPGAYARAVQRALVLALAFVVLPARAEEEAERWSKLTRVAVDDSAAGEIVVRLVGSRRPDFTTRTLHEPFRVVVEWSGSKLVGVASEREVGAGLLRKIEARQLAQESEQLSRVTLVLARETRVRFETEGSAVVVRLDKVDVEAPPPSASPTPVAVAPAPSAAPAEPLPQGPLTEPAAPPPSPVAKVVPKPTPAPTAPIAKVTAAPKPSASPAVTIVDATARVLTVDEVERGVSVDRAEAAPASGERVLASLKPSPKPTADEVARADKARAEAARAEAARAEAARAEAARAEAARAEAARAEAARAEATRAEALRMEAARAEAARAEALRVEAARAEAARVEAARVEALRVEAARAEAARAEALRVEAARAEAARAEAARAEAARAEAARAEATRAEAARRKAAPRTREDAGGFGGGTAAPRVEPAARADATTAGFGGEDFDPGARVLTYVGFRQKPETSEVFVRFDGRARYKVVSAGPERVILEVYDARINVKNNARPLDTSFFESAVTRVQAVPSGSMIKIEIDLREAVPYQVKRIGSTISLDFKLPS
jgi:hypothetical protein